MSSEGLAQYSYRELQRMCKDLNVPSAGKRAELEERLREVVAADAAVDEDEDSEDAAEDSADDVDDDDDVSGDEDDEDEEEEDDDGEPSAEPEILGMLVRAPEAANAPEGEDVYFISAEDFEREWNAANREVYGGGDDDDSDFDDEDVLEYGDDDDNDDEEDDVLFGVSTTRWDNVSRNVSNGLQAFEFFTFVVLLCGVLQETAKLSPTDGDHTVSDSQVFDEPRTLAEAIYVALLTHAFTAGFWAAVAYYVAIFYALPTVVGLVFGSYRSAESVFVFASARYALYYLLYGTAAVFSWSAFPFQERVFTVTCAGSLVMAFWEKQSTLYL